MLMLLSRIGLIIPVKNISGHQMAEFWNRLGFVKKLEGDANNNLEEYTKDPVYVESERFEKPHV
jgi:hypothetical protein